MKKLFYPTTVSPAEEELNNYSGLKRASTSSHGYSTDYVSGTVPRICTPKLLSLAMTMCARDRSHPRGTDEESEEQQFPKGT